jgi:serine protease inhibitor
MQNIRFQLNEEGVKLKSEATLGMKAMAMRPMVEPHYLVVDKPFLIMMKEKGKEPYFAMWIGNEDFLAKVKE